jgi:hypothetical protein
MGIVLGRFRVRKNHTEGYICGINFTSVVLQKKESSKDVLERLTKVRLMTLWSYMHPVNS